MKTNLTQLPKLLERTIKAKITAFIWSKPGIGKSDSVRALAKTHNLELIEVRLSQIDPLDMSGLPSVNENKTRATYLPMTLFPLETDKIPEGKNGFLLFLDEANQAPRSVQAAAFQLTLDRAIGQHKLHPNTAIILAGNNETDGGITTKISTPMMSRLAHFEVEINHTSWINWANSNGIDHRIISFIHLRPDLLNKFDPNTQDKTFSCPRTWEFTSRLIKETDVIAHDDTVLLASVLSEGVAREFASYTNIFSKLHTIKDIINNPSDIPIPNEPSVKYAYTGVIANNISLSNAPQLLKFLARLDIEFQIIAMIPAIKRIPELNTLDCVSDWKIENIHDLI